VEEWPMKMNKTSFGITLVVCFSLFFTGTGSTEKNTNKWILYGRAEDGDHYYDQQSVMTVTANIIRVSAKIKYSKEGMNHLLKLRKQYNRPIDGWNKLDHQLILLEVNCRNNTLTGIKTLLYDDQGKILYNYDDPNPASHRIKPNSKDETLLKAVCPK
jgi:hypothetical protein